MTVRGPNGREITLLKFPTIDDEVNVYEASLSGDVAILGDSRTLLFFPRTGTSEGDDQEMKTVCEAYGYSLVESSSMPVDTLIDHMVRSCLYGSDKDLMCKLDRELANMEGMGRYKATSQKGGNKVTCPHLVARAIAQGTSAITQTSELAAGRREPEGSLLLSSLS